MKPRLLVTSGLLTVYIALFAAMDGLRFDPDKDEVHFWPTSLRFSDSWIPPVELLRDYGELSTPLPFMIFGTLEHALGGGIFAGRLFNLVLSFGIVALIVLTARGPMRRVLGATLGLLAFPYFLGTSCYLYTDVIAASFVLAGVWLHWHRLSIPAAVCFALAIASRQYAVAFPLAVAAWELIALRGEGSRRHARWIAPLVAASTLMGWFLFFGGLAPPAELERQGLTTAPTLGLRPQHMLYFLACVGVYFVAPEIVLLQRLDWLRRLTLPRIVLITVGLGLFFLVFPPLRNPPGYPIETMGFLDKAARRVLGDCDVLRVMLFGAAALLACLRFSRLSLPMLLVLANAALMMKAHIAWDKYALPLVIVLWFMAANEGPISPNTAPSGREARSDP